MTKTYENISIDRLIEESLSRGEGEIAANGSLLVKTGKRTGKTGRGAAARWTRR